MTREHTTRYQTKVNVRSKSLQTKDNEVITGGKVIPSMFLPLLSQLLRIRVHPTIITLALHKQRSFHSITHHVRHNANCQPAL